MYRIRKQRLRTQVYALRDQVPLYLSLLMRWLRLFICRYFQYLLLSNSQIFALSRAPTAAKSPNFCCRKSSVCPSLTRAKSTKIPNTELPGLNEVYMYVLVSVFITNYTCIHRYIILLEVYVLTSLCVCVYIVRFWHQRHNPSFP